MKVALFCVFRNTQIYINEYIEHYLNLGFNDIYLIDNSDSDKLDIILDPKFRNNVFIINIRSKDLIDNFVAYQIKLYTSLYNIYSFKYDWLAFFDDDEYLILNKHNSIQEYLNCDLFTNVDQIHINWLVFDDNDQLYYKNEPLIKRFTRISKKYYDLYKEAANGVKSILRSNLDLHFITPHTAVSNTDNALITVDNDGLYYSEWYSSHNKLHIDYAQLNHYITKSTEEYLQHKIINPLWNLNDKYFEVNKYTNEKIQMFKSLNK